MTASQNTLFEDIQRVWGIEITKDFRNTVSLKLRNQVET